MTLGCHLAAPTPIRTSAGWLVVARLRLSDYALLLTAAADALGRDDDGGHGVEFGNDATMAWAFGDGLPMLLWLALRRDRPGLTIEDAEGLTLTADDAVAVTRAAFRRAKDVARGEDGQGKDVASADWGPMLFFFLKHHHAFPPAVGELTLDQLHSLMSGGDDGSSKVLQSDMQAQWLEMQRAKAEAVTKVAPGLVPVTLEDLGFRVVPEAEGDSTNGEVIGG